MPLLMIDREEVLPPENALIVPGGEARAFRVKTGQLLAVTDLEGGQPAAMFAVADEDNAHFLSPHHTRVFSNSFVLRLGMRLVTNRRRPALVLGVSAPHLAHDLLMPIAGGPDGGSDALRASVRKTFREQGSFPETVADPVNLFLDIGVGLDGSLEPRGVSSRAGDTIVMRSVMDMTFVIAAPAQGALWSRPTAGAIGIQVRNEVRSIQGLKQGT